MKKIFMTMAVAAMTIGAFAQGDYSITPKDTWIRGGQSINKVKNIEVTFDANITDWKLGGSKNDETTVAGVDLTGKYMTSAGTNGAPIQIKAKKAGKLTIFLGGAVATTKKVFMKEGDTKINGKVLSTGAEQECGKNPVADIKAWDGLVYDIEADKEYTFYISGAKWRFAGFKFE
jgi:hypothetical protein